MSESFAEALRKINAENFDQSRKNIETSSALMKETFGEPCSSAEASPPISDDDIYDQEVCDADRYRRMRNFTSETAAYIYENANTDQEFDDLVDDLLNVQTDITVVDVI